MSTKNTIIKKKLQKLNEFLFAEYLATDEPFGVLTRPALELCMSTWTWKSKIYIVDFNNVHKLNNEFGYEKVNSIIKGAITDFTYSMHYPKGKKEPIDLTWGRVFSGDEIAVLEETGYPLLMEEFAVVCKKYKLGFKWIEDEIQLGKSPQTYQKELNKLTQRLKDSKFAKMIG